MRRACSPPSSPSPASRRPPRSAMPTTTTATFPLLTPSGPYTNTYYYGWAYAWFAYYNYAHGPYANWWYYGAYATYGWAGRPAATPTRSPAPRRPRSSWTCRKRRAEVQRRVVADHRQLADVPVPALSYGQDYGYDLVAEVTANGKTTTGRGAGGAAGRRDRPGDARPRSTRASGVSPPVRFHRRAHQRLTSRDRKGAAAEPVFRRRGGRGSAAAPLRSRLVGVSGRLRTLTGRLPQMRPTCGSTWPPSRSSPATCNRVVEIVRTLAKYGLADWLARLDPGFVRRLGRRHRDSPGSRTRTHEARVRLALTELGTTFIKLGQMLSTRRDLIGAGAGRRTRRSCRANVPADPFAVTTATVEAELGRPLAELFAHVRRRAARVGVDRPGPPGHAATTAARSW